jgi:hypothetical protein
MSRPRSKAHLDLMLLCSSVGDDALYAEAKRVMIRWMAERDADKAPRSRPDLASVSLGE